MSPKKNLSPTSSSSNKGKGKWFMIRKAKKNNKKKSATPPPSTRHDTIVAASKNNPNSRPTNHSSFKKNPHQNENKKFLTTTTSATTNDIGFPKKHDKEKGGAGDGMEEGCLHSLKAAGATSVAPSSGGCATRGTSFPSCSTAPVPPSAAPKDSKEKGGAGDGMEEGCLHSLKAAGATSVAPSSGGCATRGTSFPSCSTAPVPPSAAPKDSKEKGGAGDGMEEGCLHSLKAAGATSVAPSSGGCATRGTSFPSCSTAPVPPSAAPKDSKEKGGAGDGMEEGCLHSLKAAGATSVAPSSGGCATRGTSFPSCSTAPVPPSAAPKDSKEKGGAGDGMEEGCLHSLKAAGATSVAPSSGGCATRGTSFPSCSTAPVPPSAAPKDSKEKGGAGDGMEEGCLHSLKAAGATSVAPSSGGCATRGTSFPSRSTAPVPPSAAPKDSKEKGGAGDGMEEGCLHSLKAAGATSVAPSSGGCATRGTSFPSRSTAPVPPSAAPKDSKEKGGAGDGMEEGCLHSLKAAGATSVAPSSGGCATRGTSFPSRSTAPVPPSAAPKDSKEKGGAGDGMEEGCLHSLRAAGATSVAPSSGGCATRGTSFPSRSTAPVPPSAAPKDSKEKGGAGDGMEEGCLHSLKAAGATSVAPSSGGCATRGTSFPSRSTAPVPPSAAPKGEGGAGDWLQPDSFATLVASLVPFSSTGGQSPNTLSPISINEFLSMPNEDEEEMLQEEPQEEIPRPKKKSLRIVLKIKNKKKEDTTNLVNPLTDTAPASDSSVHRPSSTRPSTPRFSSSSHCLGPADLDSTRMLIDMNVPQKDDIFLLEPDGTRQETFHDDCGSLPDWEGEDTSHDSDSDYQPDCDETVDSVARTIKNDKKKKPKQIPARLPLLSEPFYFEGVNSIAKNDGFLSDSFYFEEMSPAWHSLESKEQADLLLLEALDPERLKFVETLHQVKQPLSGWQCTRARSLNSTPHYQEQIDHDIFQDFGRKHTHAYPCKESDPPTDAFIEILDVQNFPEIEQLSLTLPDWKAKVYDEAKTKKVPQKKSDKKSSVGFRQKYHIDAGFAGGIYCPDTRTCPLKITRPSHLASTNSSLAKTTLVALSKILVRTGKDWNLGKERIADFAGRLVGGNIIEGLRVAVTDVNDPSTRCSIHLDSNNDPDYPSVFVLSIVIDSLRYSFICYTRKSISEYYIRCAQTRPVYNWIETHSTAFAGKLVEPSVTWANESVVFSSTWKYSLVQPASVNPGIFQSHFVAAIKDVSELYNRSRPLSLDQILFLAYVFASLGPVCHWVHDALHQKGSVNKTVKFKKEFTKDDALLLLHTAIHLRADERDFTKAKHCRYNWYYTPVPSDYTVSTLLDWVEASRGVLIVAWSRFTKIPVSEKARANVYKGILLRMKEGIMNFGALGCNHLIGSLCIAGLLPAWLYGQVVLDKDSSVYQFFVNHFDMPNTQDACDSFFKSACRRFEICPRTFENKLCKLFQLTEEGDSKGDGGRQHKGDIIRVNQPAFYYKKNADGASEFNQSPAGIVAKLDPDSKKIFFEETTFTQLSAVLGETKFQSEMSSYLQQLRKKKVLGDGVETEQSSRSAFYPSLLPGSDGKLGSVYERRKQVLEQPRTEEDDHTKDHQEEDGDGRRKKKPRTDDDDDVLFCPLLEI